MLLELHGWIPDLIEAHLENLDFLWSGWASARASSDYLWHELARLEERVEANVDALVLAEDEAEEQLEAGLGGDSLGVITGCALAWLRRGRIDEVHAKMLAAAPAAALAIAEAFAFVDAPVHRALEATLDEASPAAVVGAARALALRGRPVPDRVLAHLADADPLVRAACWRVAGDLMARGLAAPLARSAFEAAFADESTAEAAWWAAAWSRQKWLVSHASQHATTDVNALATLARLGGPSDKTRVIEALSVEALGPLRFDFAASLGTADVADALLSIASVPATRAFARITDLKHILDETVALVGPDGDPDLAETAHLPNLPLLQRDWAKLRKAGPRRSHAIDVDAAELTELDCQARAERILREVYRGQRAPEWAILERFPLAKR